MAKWEGVHVIEIGLEEEIRQQIPAVSNKSSIILQHPLTEISRSPGHLLLLKLWQREEEKYNACTSRREHQMDNIKREVFQLCCLFLAFHGFSLTFLFNFSGHLQESGRRQWWIPSSLLLVTSAVIICFVQSRLHRFQILAKQLQRDRMENRALARCIQELRMKGASFDLSKEPLTGRRLRSSSVQIRWKPLEWLSHNIVTLCLLCFTGFLVPFGKFILCG